MNSRRRDGTEVETYDGQAGIIRFLYTTLPGRVLLKLLVQPWVSRMAGRFLDSRLSRRLVGPFVRKNHIDLTDYPEKDYLSFNDFFTRSIRPERRPVDQVPSHLVAPCDGKLTAIPLTEDARFPIKGVPYTLARLLQNAQLAQHYRGGWLLLFRLTVDDYHRYCFPAEGQVGKEHRIPGVFHTVNPLAAELRPIYHENTRAYTALTTAQFGTILMMEVGALLVGRISNHPGLSQVTRGQEKGMFQFGGSTVVLLLEPGILKPDEDILRNSQAGAETIVKMGERIGQKIT
jgi:phosphatidylserine decarboxylase